jgi:hypothetical protein
MIGTSSGFDATFANRVTARFGFGSAGASSDGKLDAMLE